MVLQICQAQVAALHAYTAFVQCINKWMNKNKELGILRPLKRLTIKIVSKAFRTCLETFWSKKITKYYCILLKNNFGEKL